MKPSESRSTETLRRPAPVRRAPGQWGTLPECKRVLVVVHTLVYAVRLREIFELLRADLRVQVVFTIAPHAFNEGVHDFLRGLGCAVLPWPEAVATEFDLALAAGSQGIEQIRGPLVRLPHGAGSIKLSRPAEGPHRTVGGLGRPYLTWAGRVVPAAIALAHRAELTMLEHSCPEALPVAEVVGDSCHDRIAASRHLREAYRHALGLRPEDRFVLVSSTWGLGSSFNRLDALLPRLLAELPPAGFRTGLLVHPNVWSFAGRWQLEAWLAGAAGQAVHLLPPETDWRALLIAADYVIGDHGSVTLYATMTRAPILLARFPFEDVNPDSAAATLARTAPALSASHPLPAQLAYARQEYRPAEYAAIARRITSEPGRFNRKVRRLLYRLLGLGEPAYDPVTAPLDFPLPLPAVRP
ncbi:hypothetical protein CFP65_7523 [Kitasatospora sp. MMS16-BH015]|uniref:hypothetical protein n=1 Tax=Kitasatospora sp. MMS16-BH015 TaxID=2018025 RepID=UPI000CA2047B|nr:hypothetical protein [Kitasatospora sp. MMS16-BH015]AUG82098.1 hypothetical protein CFP65_7523 [Kitasatospora sp. MMS16-BH015]